MGFQLVSSSGNRINILNDDQPDHTGSTAKRPRTASAAQIGRSNNHDSAAPPPAGPAVTPPASVSSSPRSASPSHSSTPSVGAKRSFADMSAPGTTPEPLHSSGHTLTPRSVTAPGAQPRAAPPAHSLPAAACRFPTPPPAKRSPSLPGNEPSTPGRSPARSPPAPPSYAFVAASGANGLQPPMVVPTYPMVGPVVYGYARDVRGMPVMPQAGVYPQVPQVAHHQVPQVHHVAQVQVPHVPQVPQVPHVAPGPQGHPAQYYPYYVPVAGQYGRQPIAVAQVQPMPMPGAIPGQQMPTPNTLPNCIPNQPFIQQVPQPMGPRQYPGYPSNYQLPIASRPPPLIAPSVTVRSPPGKAATYYQDKPAESAMSPTQSGALRQPKKYTCSCSRSFTTSGHLARHMRIHTGEKNYQCPFENCNARFSRQDNCMQHYRTHLGGRARPGAGKPEQGSDTGAQIPRVLPAAASESSTATPQHVKVEVDNAYTTAPVAPAPAPATDSKSPNALNALAGVALTVN